MFAQWTAIPTKTVTFNSNGGSGIDRRMRSTTFRQLSRPTASRARASPSPGWNTAANGSGTAYANSASYAFTADATMFAQWTAIPTKTVTFDNNGGSGSIADEVANVPTPLTTNSFTRAGFTFGGWNTAANGSGTSYPDAASYPFAVDATLFAQWTAIPNKTVTFDSNGGAGSIADEVNNVPAALTSNSFTRAGYNFVGWNTAANGSGTSYADTASFPFAVDATMFAQWSILPVLSFDVNGGTGTVASLTGIGSHPPAHDHGPAARLHLHRMEHRAGWFGNRVRPRRPLHARVERRSLRPVHQGDPGRHGRRHLVAVRHGGLVHRQRIRDGDRGRSDRPQAPSRIAP